MTQVRRLFTKGVFLLRSVAFQAHLLALPCTMKRCLPPDTVKSQMLLADHNPFERKPLLLQYCIWTAHRQRSVRQHLLAERQHRVIRLRHPVPLEHVEGGENPLYWCEAAVSAHLVSNFQTFAQDLFHVLSCSMRVFDHTSQLFFEHASSSLDPFSPAGRTATPCSSVGEDQFWPSSPTIPPIDKSLQTLLRRWTAEKLGLSDDPGLNKSGSMQTALEKRLPVASGTSNTSIVVRYSKTLR